LCASTVEYNIKSMGMKIAYISVNRNESQRMIVVKTHSLKINSIFPQLNNTYRISYDEMLRPLVFSRSVEQKELNEEAKTTYDHNLKTASLYRSSTNTSKDYTIGKNSREPFSLLAYISSGKAIGGIYNIDGNGLPWQAHVLDAGIETVKTPLGKYSARRYNITFTNLTGKKMPYIDMVTHNMLSESSKLSLWVSDEEIILKALIKKGAVSMTWDIIGITE